MEAGTLKEAVRACIQEEPTEFLGYKLFDPGAWPEPPICRKIVMRVTEPWRPELDERQKRIVEQTLEATRKIGEKAHPGDDELRRKRREDDLRFLALLGIKPKKKNDVSHAKVRP